MAGADIDLFDAKFDAIEDPDAERNLLMVWVTIRRKPGLRRFPTWSLVICGGRSGDSFSLRRAAGALSWVEHRAKLNFACVWP
jgi:hypothetical protein